MMQFFIKFKIVQKRQHYWQTFKLFNSLKQKTKKTLTFKGAQFFESEISPTL